MLCTFVAKEQNNFIGYSMNTIYNETLGPMGFRFLENHKHLCNYIGFCSDASVLSYYLQYANVNEYTRGLISVLFATFYNSVASYMCNSSNTGTANCAPSPFKVQTVGLPIPKMNDAIVICYKKIIGIKYLAVLTAIETAQQTSPTSICFLLRFQPHFQL